MKNVRIDVRKYLLCGLNIAQKQGVNAFSYKTSRSFHSVMLDDQNNTLHFTTRDYNGKLVAETHMKID